MYDKMLVYVYSTYLVDSIITIHIGLFLNSIVHEMSSVVDHAWLLIKKIYNNNIPSTAFLVSVIKIKEKKSSHHPAHTYQVVYVMEFTKFYK